jgi:hypothetical protein
MAGVLCARGRALRGPSLVVALWRWPIQALQRMRVWAVLEMESTPNVLRTAHTRMR